MEFKNVVRILHRSWILILVCTLFAVAGAATYSFTTTPQYVASTQLYVSVQTGEASGAADLLQGTSFVRQAVASYVLVVGSPVVLNDVIDELGLDVTAAQLAPAIVVDTEVNTAVIDIAVTDSDPEAAAEIANSVGENFSRIVVEELEKPAGIAVSPVQIATIGPALAPTKPTSPNIPLNIGLGLIVGLGLGVGLAILRNLLDTRVRDLEDIADVTDAPILGGISIDSQSKSRPLVAQDVNNPRAESFRSLRTNLQYVSVENGPRSFVVTSSIPGEGKSTTSANLAITLAANGARVALIDGDLRLSSLADYMGIEGGAGLTDVLIGRVGLDDVLQKWGRDELYVLASGGVPPNPSELLGSASMQRLLSTLTERFDIVLIDAPPILSVTDAAVLAKQSGGALMVVGAGRTKRSELAAAVSALARVDVRIVGIVANMLPTNGPGAHSYGGYGSHGKYGADVVEETTTRADSPKARDRISFARTRSGRAE